MDPKFLQVRMLRDSEACIAFGIKYQEVGIKKELGLML